ncbi:hypothetical protein GZH46_00923, partial [Fragariocoptes setiger]
MADPSECNIKVVCRFRPLSEAERKAGSEYIVRIPPGSQDQVNIRGKTYMFDRVFGPDATQERVYEEAAKPIVKDVLCGYNGTIFAYGQTSSGKTHTMEGIIGDSHMQGIIPRIIDDIFNHIYSLSENVEFHIKVSYFEIYMDKIRDLIDITRNNLSVHENKDRVPYVKGSTERFVSNPLEVLQVIEEGKANRHIAVTNMNEHSSRSHSVFLIDVKQENLDNQKTRTGRLYLVDLAGSEKVSKTGAEGMVLDEAKNINKSLSALGNVISALADGNKSHIPYRDSKLTRILQESLGGNSRTTIIICGSPASFNEMETKSTLDFGRRAKTIKNTVIVNEILTAEEWKRRYEKEREKAGRLRSQLSKIENELSRWRGGEAVPNDEQINLKEIDVSSLSESVQNLSGLQSSFPGGSSTAMLPIGNEERMRIEEEHTRLNAQLDEKEAEIDRLNSCIERLQVQMQDQETLLGVLKRNCDDSEAKMKDILADSKATKEESKGLLNALKEMGGINDAMESELNAKINQINSLSQEVTSRSIAVNTIQAELEQTKESNIVQLKRLSEMLTNFLKELNEIAEVLGTPPASTSVSLNPSGTQPNSAHEVNNKLEDEFTVARLYINKMKSEVKTLVSKCQQLDSFNSETSKKLQSTERELDELKLKITQHEAKMSNLQASMRDIENKKRALEEMVDQLNEDNAKLKAQEEMHIMTSKEREKEKDSAEQIKIALETQIEKHRESHQKQLSLLRDEIAEKEADIEKLKDANQKFLLAQEKNQIDLEKLREELDEKTAKLNELSLSNDRMEQAKQDLRGLEETVARELQTLSRLRKMFVNDLLTRVKKSAAGEDSDVGGSQIQQEKILFLENNLDKLTSVHKQLVRDNSDLRVEKPRLQKHLQKTLERVKALEDELRETKEKAAEDRRRYQAEVERINVLKEGMKRGNLMANRNAAQIAKPIRAGQPAIVHRPVVNPGPGN